MILEKYSPSFISLSFSPMSKFISLHTPTLQHLKKISAH